MEFGDLLTPKQRRKEGKKERFAVRVSNLNPERSLHGKNQTVILYHVYV